MSEWGTGPGPGASGPDVTPAQPTNATQPYPAYPAYPDAPAIPVGADPFDPYGLLDQALAERRAAVELCLYALDRARSSGVAERIERGLAQLGVVAVRPDGLPFDPARHEAAGTVPTEDPDLDGVVAETEAVGFTDHGRPLRAPVVLVYQRSGG
ncbi:MAG TPA: nucleotide exchange factor GrpE [Pseudonocardiaceae bacterium]|jgi:hypothetical protein|nr:nucleotide exchange factor GrpE [Pseudonocardiaceae bacterium]